MLSGNSLEFFKVTLASPSSIQCFTRKITMFHIMHDLQLVELDCRHRVTPAASPQHRHSTGQSHSGDCLGPSWSALVSACLLNLSTLKVISNLVSLLFCSFGELLNETLDLCLHSCLLSAPWPYQLTHLEQIFCLICHTHSDTGVAPAKHLDTFNCS